MTFLHFNTRRVKIDYWDSIHRHAAPKSVFRQRKKRRVDAIKSKNKTLIAHLPRGSRMAYGAFIAPSVSRSVKNDVCATVVVKGS